jgi:NAD(P)-dependent dehydrogenase (short-subunit alcohol dehydrogenase family)
MSDVIVVTGASGALGGAVARLLVAKGDRVAALGSAGPGLEALARELGEACLPVALDLTSAAAWAEALPRITSRLGAPTGAVLTAGAWRGGKPLHEDDDATWDAMLGANVDTARRRLRALLPGMVARRSGSIVVIGSRAVPRPESSVRAAAAAAAKAALVALAQTVAAEVLADGVRVNAVLPSTIDTPANRAAMPAADFTSWVSLASLAGVIAFLLSAGARDVSGAALPVYGRA